MVARDIGRLGQRLITPAAISVLVFGVWLVAADPYLNFTDTWIEVGLLGYLITLITGAGFLGPESARLGKLSAERDPADPEIQERIQRIFMVRPHRPRRADRGRRRHGLQTGRLSPGHVTSRRRPVPAVVAVRPPRRSRPRPSRGPG